MVISGGYVVQIISAGLIKVILKIELLLPLIRHVFDIKMISREPGSLINKQLKHIDFRT